MAKAQELGPTDVAAAVIDGGKLIVIDGRGMPWTYDYSVKKNALGKELEAPESADHAFVINERLHVISGGVCWTYYPGQDGWVEGFELDTKAEAEVEGAPWIKGRSIETRVAIPDELRRAHATIAAAEAVEEAAAEAGSTKRRKKTKEHA
jgi:hypothetical protein